MCKATWAAEFAVIALNTGPLADLKRKAAVLAKYSTRDLSDFASVYGILTFLQE